MPILLCLTVQGHEKKLDGLCVIVHSDLENFLLKTRHFPTIVRNFLHFSICYFFLVLLFFILYKIDMKMNLLFLIILGTTRATWMTRVDVVDDLYARCLDGSNPIYYFQPGTGPDTDKWVYFITGGSWCFDDAGCAGRSQGFLGSSNGFPSVREPDDAGGILSDDPSYNPQFYQWNKVYLPYCDGSSFTGNRTEPVVYGSQTIYYRGAAILPATTRHLLTNQGMDQASVVVLSGDSAGGLSVLHNCDKVARHLLDYNIPLKCLPDAGLFPNVSTVYGTYHFGYLFRQLVQTHHSYSSFHPLCLAAHPNDPESCMFPEYFIQYLTTPSFYLNDMYDAYTVNHDYFIYPSSTTETETELAPVDAACYQGRFLQCNTDQRNFMDGKRLDYLNWLQPIQDNTRDGLFLTSCGAHVQSCFNMWYSWLPNTDFDNPKIGYQTIHDAFADWLFQRVPIQQSKKVMLPYYSSDQRAGDSCAGSTVGPPPTLAFSSSSSSFSSSSFSSSESSSSSTIDSSSASSASLVSLSGDSSSASLVSLSGDSSSTGNSLDSESSTGNSSLDSSSGQVAPSSSETGSSVPFSTAMQPESSSSTSLERYSSASSTSDSAVSSSSLSSSSSSATDSSMSSSSPLSSSSGSLVSSSDSSSTLFASVSSTSSLSSSSSSSSSSLSSLSSSSSALSMSSSSSSSLSSTGLSPSSSSPTGSSTFSSSLSSTGSVSSSSSTLSSSSSSSSSSTTVQHGKTATGHKLVEESDSSSSTSVVAVAETRLLVNSGNRPVFLAVASAVFLASLVQDCVLFLLHSI